MESYGGGGVGGGSLQSSSGGDDDFVHNPAPPPPPFLFDASLSGFRFPNQNPPPLLNLDMLILPTKPIPPSSSDTFRILPSPPPPPQQILSNRPPPPAAARHSKKRSRASRRAPTTVLTTDTSNFRAMVQEFTGIPPPPFTSNSSVFPSNFNSNIFRPFPHKIQTPQIMNTNPHLGNLSNSELGQIINLYSLPNTNSSTIFPLPTTFRPATTDQNFSQSVAVSRPRSNETSGNDYSHWDGNGNENENGDRTGEN